MNSDVFVSIIIPTYNTKVEYLLNAIKTICDQSYDNIEVLVIDDGSDKDYRADLDDIRKRDSRIQVIYKDHSGVSDARNVGIQNSKGDYLSFVDSDDQINPCFLNSAISAAKEYKYPDVIIGGIEYRPYRLCNDTQFGDKIDCYINSEIDILKKSLLHIRDPRVKYNILGSPCGRLYKSELLKDNNILFPQGVALCEDQIFNRKVLLNAKSVIVVPEMWYIYEQNEFSVMHTKVEKNLWKMKEKYWDELYKLDCLESDEMKDGIRGFYVRSFFNTSSSYCRNKGIDNNVKKQIIREMLNHPIIETATGNLKFSSDIPLGWKVQWFFLKLKRYIPINILSHFVS